MHICNTTKLRNVHICNTYKQKRPHFEREYQIDSHDNYCKINTYLLADYRRYELALSKVDHPHVNAKQTA